MQRRGVVSLLIMGMLAAGRAQAADESALPSWFDLDVRGLLDARLALTSQTKSWEDGGLGKVRWGSDGGAGVLARPEGALVIQPHFGFDWSGFIQLSASSQQRPAVDLQEAYIAYKTPPASRFSFKARAGIFFPPISMENDGLAWTSPYTITSSAINTWVGEELRTIGGEGTLSWRPDEAVDIGVTGALFKFNDPAGTLLAWRGWTISDREVGIFDRVPLPPVRIIRPGANLDKQAMSEEPYHEIDERFGYYAAAHLTHDGYGRLQALRYDNRADDRDIEYQQWAWRTRFWSVGYTSPEWLNFTFIAQYMTGTTTVISLPAPRMGLVYTGFWSAYALVSKDWGRHRLSLRVERFGADDGDTFPDNNNEHGAGVTAAYVFRPTARQRVTLEVLHVDSHRPERVYLGFPAKAHETVLQGSYRFFFGTGG
ncbi:MAG: hypothetical protein AB7H70_12590 [Rhodospirillaceae bacterium]